MLLTSVSYRIYLKGSFWHLTVGKRDESLPIDCRSYRKDCARSHSHWRLRFLPNSCCGLKTVGPVFVGLRWSANHWQGVDSCTILEVGKPSFLTQKKRVVGTQKFPFFSSDMTFFVGDPLSDSIELPHKVPYFYGRQGKNCVKKGRFFCLKISVKAIRKPNKIIFLHF